MELSIKPYHTSLYPIKGVLIKDPSAKVWAKEIQQMQLSLEQITVYPLAGTIANNIWGCIIVFEADVKPQHISKHTYCQCIGGLLYIPENAVLNVKIPDAEMEQLCRNTPHVMHPDFGLAALTDPIDWSQLLSQPEAVITNYTEPADSIVLPKKIRSLQVKENSPEDVLKEMDEKLFPKRETFPDKPLTPLEQLKLYVLRGLFKKTGNGRGSANAGSEKNEWLQKLENFFSPGKSSKLIEDMQTDYEELEKRNQKEMDKLLELLRNNPEEALKYAIPLDSSGTGRGGDTGLFQLSKLWSGLFLLAEQHSSRGSGSFVIPPNQYSQLQQQYQQAAREMENKGEYQKAAFIYMKLLKQYYLAAQALEKGKLYPEAASVYLKHLGNKLQAAECYEKGNMISQAIEIHKELNNDEKIGDLYLRIHKKGDAFHYFEKAAGNHRENHKYLKASFIYRNKMNQVSRAQEELMKGWEEDKDAFNCLNNYFNNIPEVDERKPELEKVYATKVDQQNKETFLQVLRQEHKKDEAMEERTREIAHEIIADLLPTNPEAANSLRFFTKTDTSNLAKDILKYRQQRKLEP